MTNAADLIERLRAAAEYAIYDKDTNTLNEAAAALETAQETIRLLMEHNEELKRVAAVYAVGKQGDVKP